MHVESDQTNIESDHNEMKNVYQKVNSSQQQSLKNSSSLEVLESVDTHTNFTSRIKPHLKKRQTHCYYHWFKMHLQYSKMFAINFFQLMCALQDVIQFQLVSFQAFICTPPTHLIPNFHPSTHFSHHIHDSFQFLHTPLYAFYYALCVLKSSMHLCSLQKCSLKQKEGTQKKNLRTSFQHGQTDST